MVVLSPDSILLVLHRCERQPKEAVREYKPSSAQKRVVAGHVRRQDTEGAHSCCWQKHAVLGAVLPVSFFTAGSATVTIMLQYWYHIGSLLLLPLPLHLQAQTCSAAGSSQAACEKSPYCVFNPQVKRCLRSQVAKPGQNAYDDKLSALMNACGKLTTKSACTAKTVSLVQAGKWASFKASATSVKC